MSYINPIDIALNQATPISEEFSVHALIRGNRIYPILSGTFDGASVTIEQFVSSQQGWQPIKWRSDATTSQTITFTTDSTGDEIILPPMSKFRFVCTSATGLTNIFISISY